MMDKYSLQAYERYPSAKVLPPMQKNILDSSLQILPVAWRTLEPQRGDYRLAAIPALPEKGPALLAPALAAPAWAENDPLYADAFIRRLGAATGGGAGFAGVLADVGLFPPVQKPALLQAFAAAFDKSVVILPAHDGDAIAAMRRMRLPFGLLLDASQGLLPLREQMARQNLQQVWQLAPVFLLAKNAPEDEAVLIAAARGWHVAAADIKGVSGAAIALRRLMLPQKITAGGALPLRFWWQNIGSSPLYGQSTVRLWLRGTEGTITELPLCDAKPLRRLGDDTHNEILRLPNLPAGAYTLVVGLFDAFGQAIPLASDLPNKQGCCDVAALALDDEPRPDLFTAWDDYYPEGYYPLEDPKLPV